jgi:hypothetical protein
MKLLGVLIAGLSVNSAVQLDTKPISVKHRFQSEDVVAELEGVCKVTTEDVGCWKPDGTPNRSLRDDVLAYLRQNSRLDRRYGKKTRYAVFRVRQRFDARSPISFSAAWNLTDRTLRDAEQRYAVAIVADPAESTGAVAGQIQVTPEQSAPLKLSVGEKLNYLGGSLRIDKVIRSQADLSESDSSWLIYVTYAGPIFERTWWTAFDNEDIPISAVDPDGRPAFVDPYFLSLATGQYSVGSRTVRPGIRVARLNPSIATNGQLREGPNILVTNIDPAHIRYATLGTSAVQAIRFTDIPLEPK